MKELIPVSPKAAAALLEAHGYTQTDLAIVRECGGFVTVDEAAKFLGMTDGGVRATAQRGLIRVTRIGGHAKRCATILVDLNSARDYRHRRSSRTASA